MVVVDMWEKCVAAMRQCAMETAEATGTAFHLVPIGSEQAFPFKGLVIHKKDPWKDKYSYSS